MTPRQLAGLRPRQPRTLAVSAYRRSQQHRNLSRPSIASAIESLTSPFLSRPTPSPLSALRSGASDLLAAVDPLKLAGKELGNIRSNVRRLLGSRHPALDTIAKYYLGSNEGKQVRPLVVLLIAQATNGISPSFDRLWSDAGKSKGKSAAEAIDEPLSSADILNDPNPSLFASPSSASSDPSTSILPTQLRLAEITEMIHVASLLHDDVIDAATSRRGQPSSPSQFGNKLSILAGDFLLARASVALSRLGSLEVVELVASVLANLVEGEVMQMKGNTPTSTSSQRPPSPSRGLTPEIFDHYMHKTYLKTASLIAKSSRAATILGGCGIRSGWAAGEKINDAAYNFGRNLGIAFQLVDDSLDFTASASVLGKPSQGADLKLGLATAPALYAWEEYPQMGEMIQRKFEREGDAEEARELVLKSKGLDRTRDLAHKHASMARQALRESFPETEAREALDELARKTVERTK